MTLHGYCFTCRRDFFYMNHIARHNIDYRDHEVKILDHGDYNPKTGMKPSKREWMNIRHPVVRRLEDLFKN